MTQSVDELHRSMLRFGVVDYSVFATILVVSLGIGIYYSFFQKNQSIEEYLLGGRRLIVLPVALSLLATLMSPILVVGLPTEMYVFGIQMSYTALSVIIVGLQMQFLYIQIFHDLKITTVYEYLNLRFDNSIRVVCGLLFCINMVMWIPLMLFITSIAFNQVTEVSSVITSTVLSVVCILYTCNGGLKAVVWTDVIQVLVTCISLIVFIIKGTAKVGGFGVVWQRGVEGDRIEPPRWTLDVTERITFVNTLAFGIVSFTSYNLHQSNIQRYLSLPTLVDVKQALWIFQFSYMGYIIVASYCGLLTYAYYFDCDPLATRLVQKPDQVLPLFMMDVLGHIPGLTGLFIAGVCSATLSSMSTALNSLAAVVLKDFVNGICKRNPNNRQSNMIMSTVVIVSGLVCLALSVLVEKLGTTLLQLGTMAQSIPNGPMLGVFTCATLLPWVTTKGVISGALSGIVFICWISIGAQSALSSGNIRYPTKPMGNVDGCTYNYTRAFRNVTVPVLDDKGYVFPLYQVSYMWFSLFGWLVTVVVALVVSFATGHRDPATVDEKLLSPIIRRYFRNSKTSQYKPVKLQVMNED